VIAALGIVRRTRWAATAAAAAKWGFGCRRGGQLGQCCIQQLGKRACPERERHVDIERICGCAGRRALRRSTVDRRMILQSFEAQLAGVREHERAVRLLHVG
jgi:hypothetical protein